MALRLTTPAAIVLGSVIVAAGIIGAQLVPRYQVAAPSMTFTRLNVTTGAIDVCYFQRDAGMPESRQTVHCHADFP